MKYQPHSEYPVPAALAPAWPSLLTRSRTVQSAAQAIPTVDQDPKTAISTHHPALRAIQVMPHTRLYRDSRRPARDWQLRLALKMQDALGDMRSELASVVAPNLSTSSVARVVSRWLANSRWLRVGPSRPTRSTPQHLVAPNPFADALCHLPKVILAILLLGGLRLRSSCSWRVTEVCVDDLPECDCTRVTSGSPSDAAEAVLPETK